ncbi:Os08g0447100, partial [Oryza sativa Japonica Group]
RQRTLSLSHAHALGRSTAEEAAHALDGRRQRWSSPERPTVEAELARATGRPVAEEPNRVSCSWPCLRAHRQPRLRTRHPRPRRPPPASPPRPPAAALAPVSGLSSAPASPGLGARRPQPPPPLPPPLPCVRAELVEVPLLARVGPARGLPVEDLPAEAPLVGVGVGVGLPLRRLVGGWVVITRSSSLSLSLTHTLSLSLLPVAEEAGQGGAEAGTSGGELLIPRRSRGRGEAAPRG